MASTQATIDLVVRGSNAVNKLVQDVNQLQSAVDRINSRTLDVGPANLQRRANSLAAVMEGSAARANDLGRDRNQILLQQRQAIERLTQAQLSQQRAIEKAASTEKELVRLGRRDELASRRVSELRDALRESAGQAEQFGDRMAEASASATTLQSRLNQIRQATRNAISAASGLIDVNQTLSAANAVNALAREYNKYGDSLRRSTRESGLTDRTLPRQIAVFGDLRNQIEQAETSLSGLRAQLRQLGSTEVAIDIPVRPVSQRELTSPAGMAQVAQQAAESQRIQQENELRQQRNARRGEVASEIAAQEASLASLEKRAAGLGKVITGNQDSVSRMMANRNPANQTGLSASLNQIQAQAESLALIANNSAIASTAYNRFTVAAEMASIKLARAQQNTFTALAAGFSGGGGSSIPEGLRRASDVAGARSMVGQVLTEMPTIATGASEAALGSYINMLQNLKTLVPALSIEYRALEEGIARANEEMRSAQLGIVDAPSSRLGSLQAVTQRQRFEDREQKVQEKRQKDINDVFEKQNDLIDKINSSRLSGDQKVDLRERAERAVNALIENRLEDSREMTRLIERQLKAAVDLAKPKPPQVFGIAGKDFLPVSGQMPGGKQIAGSPAAKGAALRTRLSWQTALSQMEEVSKQVKDVAISKGAKVQMNWNLAFEKARDIIADGTLAGLQEGTKAAVSLGRQRFKEEGRVKDQVAKEQRKTADRKLKEEVGLFKDLTKYTEEAERNAQKLQAGYDRLKLTEALDEYLADLSNVERATDQLFKKLSTVPGTGMSSLRDFDSRLQAAVDLARPKPPQFFGVPGKDFLPVTGKLTGGGLVPGSPAAKNRIAEEERKAADREFAKNASAFKDLTKYTQEAERNAQKLQAGYDRLDLTQALDEYLVDLSNVERAADQLLKKLSTVPGTGQSSIKDFDSRLKAAVEGNGASKQLSSQTLQLEKLQKRLVEVEIDGVDVSQNKARVEKLIADIKSGQIPTSKQSVDLIAKELKDARARLGISQSQAKIDDKIADVLRGAVGGPSKKINDLAAQQKYAIEINDTYQKTEEILTSIGKASIPEAQKLALSFGIDQARNELYENRLESAQMITKEINKQLGLETAMQAGATKKKLTESSWGLAFEKAKDIRQDMGTEGLQERNEAQRIMMNQLSALQDIQTRYAIEEKKGVQLVGEKITLSNLINRIKNDELGLTIANTEAIGESIRLLNAAGRYRKNEAILNDSYGGSSSGNKATETTAQQLEARRERLLNLARGGLSQLITLEGKGVTVSSQKLEIEQAISDIQSLRNKASQQELATLASKVVAARNFASAMAIDLKAGALPGVGLQAALQKLQEARGARQDFFGGASPAEAIDKIVREFNTEKSGGAIGGAASAGENAVNSYVNGIKGGIPAAADAMADLGKAGITAIKKALRIASPSRVMLEIAKNQIDTYVNFLRSALPQIEAASKAIGEAGIPPGGGVPEEAIIKPISERRKTEFLDAEKIQKNRDIAGFATSNLIGPALDKRVYIQITDKITEFINQTRTSIDREKFFGSRFTEATEFAMGRNSRPSPELKAMLATMADFYGVPAELTPNLERVAASGDQAKQEAIQLNAVIGKFVKGLNDIANLINTGAALASPSKIQDPFAEARRIADETDASNAAAAREKAKVQEVFKDSIAKAAEMDTKNVKKATADSFAAARAQADADAKSAADILSRQILDPVETAAPEGGRRIGSAIEELFDRVAKALGFGGNGIGRGGPGNPRPPAGGGAGGNFSRDPGDLARRAAAAAQQGPEALLGLAELAKPAKASTAELEALSAVLKEFRSVLDPTIQGFDRLDNQLRETTANVDRQIERRAPDADFLTRRFGPRGGSAISEGLIGGAFPLLFGQGLGASVGGLVGGAGGGFLGGGLGFGLSLAGTALGTALDTLSQAAQDTGKALGYSIEGFESLKTAGLFASRQQEYYISKLIETGETAKATAEIQAEMIKKIGVSGVNDLMDLGDASSKLSKSWAEFNLQLQAALAGPMAGLLQWITSILEVSNKNGREEAKRRNSFIGLSDADKTAANKKISREIQARGGADAVGSQGIQDIRARVLGEFSARSNPVKARTGRLTPEQKLQELDKAIEKTEKARSIIQQGIAYERSGVDSRLSTEETVYGLRKRAIDMEREATEFRRSVEDQVFGKRQELEQKLIENERKRQQNAIDAFDLQLQKASTGLDPIAQRVVDAARDYLRIRAEGEADLQQAEKQLKLELQKIDQEVSRYKLQVEDRISQMAIQRDEFSRDVSRARLQIERQIVDYAVQAEDHRLAMVKYRYEVEIDLEKKKQIVVQNGLEDAAIQASAIRQAVQATNGTGASRLPGSISGRLDASGQNGADMPVALNNIMRSYHNGVVTEINKAGNNGNYVVVQFLDDLGNKLEATYSHVAAAVKVGQSVVGGQTIGRFDASGRTFGAHNSIDINSPGTNGALQRNRETAAARRSADMLVRGQVQGVVSGIKSDTDTYLQPGVGYFSRKTGRMVKGLTTGAGQTTPVGASPQAAMGVASTVGAAPVFKGTMTMPELPGAPRLVGINDLLQQYLQLVEKIKAATVGATAADKQRFAAQSEAARFALEQQTLAPILQYTEQNRELEFEIQKRKERNRLALEGVAPEIIEGELRILEIRRDLNSVLTGLDIAAGKVAKSELERLKINPKLVDSTFALTEATLASLVATTADTKEQEKLRAKLQAILDLKNQARGQAVTAVEGARGVAKESIMSPSEKIKEGIGKLREELAAITDTGNIAIKVADGIGNAFGQAFQGLISGSMSAQEALSSFFKGVASTFLSMAAEIIAKQMAMITLQAILRALGAFVGGGGGGGGVSTPWPSGLDFNPSAFTMPALAANGAYFSNGTATFANGGAFSNSIVSSPTLFRFADGGVTKTGEMGEAGPEAIMPLRRGPGGRLGVDASGLRAAMGPAPGSSGASPVLSMSFETTNYGGTEYVSREQLELAMAETKKAATKDGANRGMTMTLDRIKNSGSIRRRIGV